MSLSEQQNAAPAKEYRKVAMVGSWSVTKDQCPYDDVDLEIWGLAWRGDLTRVDRAFDCHDMTFLDDVARYQRRVPKDYLKHLASLDCPVYLQEKNPEVPKSQAYPLSEVQGFMLHVDPNHTKPYFASTVAYMLLLAIAEGVNEIHLYGIDLSEDQEWGYQKPNTEFYIGLARGRGIKVVIPEGSSLLTFSHVYGYEDFPNQEDTFITQTNKRKAHYEAMIKKLQHETATYDGALQECVEVLKGFRQTRRRLDSGKSPQLPDDGVPAAVQPNEKSPKKARGKNRSSNSNQGE